MRRCLWLLCLLMALDICFGFLSESTPAPVGGMIFVSAHAAESADAGHNQNAKTEMYYDEAGQPKAAENGAYGRKILSISPDKLKITYLDAEGSPMVTRSGYTSVLRTVDNGRLMIEMYLDSAGEPMTLSEGQYGYKRQYDAEGRITSVIHLNREGFPTKTYHGYDEIRREYDDNGQLKYLWYYLDGKPITLKSGQAGILKTDGKDTPVNLNGDKLFILSRFLHDNHWFCWLAAFLIVAVSRRMSDNLKIALLIFYGLFILYMTLLTREQSTYRYNFDWLWSYRTFFLNSGRRIEAINNVLLFFPFAAILYSLWPRFYGVLVVNLLFSAMIEVSQLIFRAGTCQLTDVLNNGIGSVLGLWVSMLLTRAKLLWRVQDNDE